MAVDAQGSFAAEEILPSGMHTVEVAVVDREGSGELFLRDLELRRNDWFYVGLADLNLAMNSTDGPADLLTGENAPLDFDSPADGRMAFYTTGKFAGDWKLTASADTREGPLKDMFSNFMDNVPTIARKPPNCAYLCRSLPYHGAQIEHKDRQLRALSDSVLARSRVDELCSPAPGTRQGSEACAGGHEGHFRSYPPRQRRHRRQRRPVRPARRARARAWRSARCLLRAVAVFDTDREEAIAVDISPPSC